MKIWRKSLAAGTAILLSLQLTTATPARALDLGSFVSTGGDIGSLLNLAMPILQSYASDLLGGLSIGGINLSNLITKAVFGSSGLLRGGLNLGNIVGSLGGSLNPILNKTPYGRPVFDIISTAISTGKISPSTVLNSGILQTLIGQLQKGNSNPNIDLGIDPADGTGTFGNQGVTAQDILNGIENGTITLNPDGSLGTINDPGAGGVAGTGSNPNSTIGGAGGATGTGSTSCLYSNTCSSTTPYKAAYDAATGVLGYPNPNEVRGQIYSQAESGQAMPDVYAPNSNIGAYYSGNQSDRDINRATTEQFLSKAGQQQTKDTLDATQKTVQGVSDLVKNCSTNAQSSQDLIRCNLVVSGVTPSIAAASLSTQMGMRQDNQFQKIQLGNISASMDAQRRQRDVENAGMTVRAMQSIWGTPDKF